MMATNVYKPINWTSFDGGFTWWRAVTEIKEENGTTTYTIKWLPAVNEEQS